MVQAFPGPLQPKERLINRGTASSWLHLLFSGTMRLAYSLIIKVCDQRRRHKYFSFSFMSMSISLSCNSINMLRIPLCQRQLFQKGKLPVCKSKRSWYPRSNVHQLQVQSCAVYLVQCQSTCQSIIASKCHKLPAIEPIPWSVSPSSLDCPLLQSLSLDSMRKTKMAPCI